MGGSACAFYEGEIAVNKEAEKIAILLASYNGEKYIAEQIESLLKQTEAGWELFIHDDGSTDRTPEILRRYEARYPDRIHVLDSPPCGGAKDNFLRMLREVRAPYVMFCDQDDVWLPEKVEVTLGEMKRLEVKHGAERPLLVFTDLCVTDERLHPIAARLSAYQKLDPRRTKAKELMIQNVITGCTVMLNRALVKLAITPENTTGIIMHDWWCALIAASFGAVSYVDRALVLYRQHGGNSVGAKKLNSLRYLTARIRRSADIKHSLLATRRQGAFFAETFPGADAVFREYGELGGKRKGERLHFYAKNGIRKSGWQRNLGLFVWG